MRESASTRKVATILLGSLFTGPDVGKISRLTGYSEQFVNAVCAGLYEQGVWTAAAVSFPSPGIDDGLPFWLTVYDCAEAVGLNTR